MSGPAVRLKRPPGSGSWYSRALDLALWAALAAPSAVAVRTLPAGLPRYVAAAAVPLLAVAVLLCRRRPLAALALPVLPALAHSVELVAPLYWPALAVLAFLAGRRTAEIRPALWFFAAVAVAGLPLCTIVGRDPWGWPTLLLTLLLTVTLPWLLGRLGRQYAELAGGGWRLADRMEREQQAVADRARIRERARIAGDMHDSLGHELTLLAVRAGALEVDPTLDARQQAAVGELREAAAAATGKLREIIGVLRADDDGAPVAPSAETVDELAERARAAGVDVRLEHDGNVAGPDHGKHPAGLPPMAGHAVHRVVQESLTNAAKHAPGAAVRVRIGHTAGTVSVAVVNDPPGAGTPPPGPASGGAGLVGLDERVRLAGGTLRAGPTPGGGFEVVAVLPTAPGRLRAPPAPRPGPARRRGSWRGPGRR
ncbi:sensor histidine kinase [Streptomyces sp. CA-132043]|uniref:sensor histidine kinase n=1 Tax=Streptomyces sp. CA-132043 TaxID=3240048 RepID=UPI003D91B2C2